MKKLSKSDRKAWWRSLTPEEQTAWRCNKLESLGKIPNWDKEYSQVLKEDNYLK